MNRVVHFEIHAKNMDLVQKFYVDVFGWEIKDYGPAMGNYRGVMTGKDEAGAMWKGIDGGMTERQGDLPLGGEPVNAFVCTIDVEDIDTIIAKVKEFGGTIAIDKMEIPGGMGTLAYCKDPEGNIFGIIQQVKK